MIDIALRDFFASQYAFDAAIKKHNEPPRHGAEKSLRPVLPNAGVAALYRRQLFALIDNMADSVDRGISVAYGKETSAVADLAMDDMATAILTAAIRKLRRRWYSNFDRAAQKLARYFAQKVGKRSDAALKRILKDAGWTVDFKLTRAHREVLNASIAENVALIKSIPEKYFADIEGAVMRSTATGNDLHSLSKDLLRIKGVTKKRAKFIANDQNSKANANFTRTRQLEVGGESAEAIWVHSHAGKEPRPTHVAAGRAQVRYKVSEGWYDPDPRVKARIWPGQLINCRCFGKLVVKGFS